MASEKIKPPVSLSVIILFGLILLSLQLMSSATQESSELSAMYSWLLLINALGSVVLLGLVGANIYSLTRQLKKREAGSKLTTRMVSLFVLLALAPAAIVFYFSMQFLHQGIDSWFNVEMDRAMEDALELSQASLDQRMRWHLRQTRQLTAKLEELSEPLATLEMENMRALSGASEMTLFSRQGRIIASSSSNPGDILPSLPDENIRLQLRQHSDYVALAPVREDELMIKVIVTVKSQEPEYLQALYPVPVRIADLADSVEFAFVRYQEMNFLRDSLKLSFSLVLSLVLLMSLLAAIWVAFISIGNIVAPVKELVKGTQAVASGHYDQQLPVIAQDDLGFLVESFNEMTQRIARARDEIRMAGVEVENQRAYLETILANLTAGVISFDADYTIRTVNQAAYRIFRIHVSHFVGQTLLGLAQGYSELAEPLKSIQRLVEQADDIWQQRLAFLGANGRQELLCRGTPLFSQEGGRVGAVVVFDDVTDLIQAQKNAAWGEVARRLAHEIKNPLTPIKLSAERLQHKLADRLEPKYADILQRSTRTIVQQVEAMKEMVDDFSEYAKPSKKQTTRIDLPDLVQEVLALYAVQPGVEFKADYETGLLMINGDPVNIRQVLHNMIKNALEAIDAKGRIEINLHRVQKNSTDFIEIALYDDGPGIKEQQIEQIFEPYVTTKTKGTGLGLAIVKKIIEEHGGAIWVDTSRKTGAGFIIQLPAI
ncbi:PAS domain S-box-containing protein [Candidatus Methylobacter favarea]|uniref:histidine kinase n=1 Tax=Candidatus Methylobacter favarea TaxID=2707345 RepID=A0A8S0W8H3_9GAMM|nr:ATP-binding protein [Candidatus Methylobacter favarea]CAA9889284.1 PAS domain S-box-containing protein [Candidatus Methylobacter favarea]